MSRAARVTSIETVQDFRTDLCEFGKDVKDSLCAADLHIRRTFDWLTERQKHWQKEVRVRHEEWLRAKSELTRRKEMKRQGIAPGTADQEKAFHIAQARLREAEDKVANCKRWQPLLQHAVHEYNGPTRLLSGFVDTELMQALALLDRKLEALEAYLAVAPPAYAEPGTLSSSAPAELPSVATPAPPPAESLPEAQPAEEAKSEEKTREIHS